MKKCDVLIVGGGVAGMTAACTLWEENPSLNIILAERDKVLGGVLRQCIHTGFGIKNLTGPEYESQLEKYLKKTNVEILCETEILKIEKKEEYNRVQVERTHAIPVGKMFVAKANYQSEYMEICFKYLILATGCYERPIGNLMIAGTRPEGIFGAGELQRMINLNGYCPQKRAVIIGSGDIGLIIARRLILKGCKVQRMIELQPKSPALDKNKKSCLEKYHLPLQTNSRVVEIHGENNISGVTVEDVKTGVREYIECDLLVVAAGLISDRTLIESIPEQSREIEQYTILCGNCEKIYSIADSIVRNVRLQCLELNRKLSEKNNFKDVKMTN